MSEPKMSFSPSNRDISSPDIPDVPGYKIVQPAIGEGSHGKVWLARNAIDQWQALKAVYRTHFDSQTKAYEQAWTAIQTYKLVSHQHPGLMPIDFLSQNQHPGYFYYLMPLGDSLDP